MQNDNGFTPGFNAFFCFSACADHRLGPGAAEPWLPDGFAQVFNAPIKGCQ